jgi:hypothetical protein
MQLPVVTPLGGRALMPDVRGLSAREALRVLGGIGLKPRLNGDGFVVAQSPGPGEPLEPGVWSALQLRRTAADVRRSGGGGR